MRRGGDGEVSPAVFSPDPFVLSTPRDANFTQRVSMYKQRTTAEGRFCVYFGVCESPIYTGVRMLANLSGVP